MYIEKNNLLDFFVPVLALSGTSTGPLAAINVAAANGTAGTYVCTRPCTLRTAQFHVTLANVVGTTTAPTVVFTKVPSAYIGGSNVVAETLTIPTNTVIGQSVVKEDIEVSFQTSDQLQITWTQAVGSAAGVGHANILAEANNTNNGNMTQVSISST